MNIATTAATATINSKGSPRSKWITLRRFTGEVCELPFPIRNIKRAELKVGDIVAKLYCFESDDGYEFYKVMRINAKSITMCMSDQYGNCCYKNPVTGLVESERFPLFRTYQVV